MNFNANVGPAISQMSALERALKGINRAQMPIMTQLVQMNRGQEGFGKGLTRVSFAGPLRQMDDLTTRIKKNTLTLRESYGVLKKDLANLQAYQVALNNSSIAGAQSYGNAIGSVDLRLPEFTHMNDAINRQAIRLQTAGAAWEIYGRKMMDAGKNLAFMGRQSMLTLSAPMILIGGGLASTFNKVDQQLTEVAKVYGATADAVDLSTDQIRSAARDLAIEINKHYGVAQEDTLELASSFARLGESGADLDALVSSSARLMRLGDVSTDTATSMITTLRTTMEYTKEELDDAINMMNIFENTTTLSMEDFAEGFPRMASVIKVFGGDLKDAGIIMEAFTSRGINAVEGANSLKTIAAKIARPTKQVRDLWEEMTKGTQGSFDDMAHSFDNNVPQILKHINDVQDALNVEGTMRQRWAAQIAGAHQYSKYMALGEGIANPNDEIARIQGMTDSEFRVYAKERSDREINVLMDSASAQFQQAWNNFKMWAEKAGEAILPIFTTLLNGITAVLDKTIDFGKAAMNAIGPLAPVVKNLTVLATALAAAFGPLMLLAASTMMIGGGIAKTFGRAQTLIGKAKLGGKSAFITQKERADELVKERMKHVFETSASESDELKEALDALDDTYIDVMNSSLRSADAMEQAAGKQVAAAKRIAAATQDMGDSAHAALNKIEEAGRMDRIGELTKSQYQMPVQRTPLTATLPQSSIKRDRPAIIDSMTSMDEMVGYDEAMQRLKELSMPLSIPVSFDIDQDEFTKEWTLITEGVEQREILALGDPMHGHEKERAEIKLTADAREVAAKQEISRLAEEGAARDVINRRAAEAEKRWTAVGRKLSAYTAGVGILATLFNTNNKILNGTIGILNSIALIGAIQPKIFGKTAEIFVKVWPAGMAKGVGKMTGMLKNLGSNIMSFIAKPWALGVVAGIGAATVAGIAFYRMMTSKSREYNEETKKIAETMESYSDIFGYTSIAFGQRRGEEEGEVINTEKYYAELLKEDEKTAAVISRIRRNVNDMSHITQIISIEASKLRATGATPEDVETAIKAMLVAANVPIHIKEQVLLDFSESEFKAVNADEVSLPIRDTLNEIFANNQITDRTASAGQQFWGNARHYELSKAFAGDLKGGTDLLINEFKAFEGAGEEGGRAVKLLFEELNSSMSEAWLEGVPENVRERTDALSEALAMNKSKGVDEIESLTSDSVISSLDDFDQRRLNQYREKMWALSRDLKEEFGGNDLVDWMFSSMDMDLWAAAVGENLGLVTMSATDAWDAMNRLQNSDAWKNDELSETQKMTAINSLAAAAGLKTLNEEQLRAAISSKNFGISMEEVAHVLGLQGDEVDKIKDAYDRLGDSDNIEDFIKELAELLDLDIDKVTEALNRLGSVKVDPDTGKIEELGDVADEAAEKVIGLQDAMSRGAKGDWSATFTLNIEVEPTSDIQRRFNQIFNNGMNQTMPYEMSVEDLVSTRKDVMSKAWGDVMDEMAAEAQIQIDAQKRAFKDAQQAESEAMSERHEAASKALSKQQDTEKKAFSENWKRRIDDEKKAYDDRIKAIEKTQEVEDDLERLRKRNAEREQRRLKYNQSLMQMGIDLNIAMAGGDLDEVARLTANAAVAASDYEKESIEAEQGYLKEDADKARKDQIDAIREEQKLRIESLEEQHRMEEEAMNERLEMQREELATRQKEEQKWLARKQEDQNIANEIQFQAKQRSLSRELEALRSHIPKNEAELAASTARIQSAYDAHGIQLIAKSDEWGTTIKEALARRTREATAKMSNDAMWRDFGNRVAGGVSEGAFNMSADEFQKFLRTGDMPDMDKGEWANAPSGVGPSLGYYRHEGGPIGSGTDKYNSRGGIPMNAPMRSDEQHVLAQHGEYMMNRSAHQMYGTDAMHAVNAGKAVILRHEGGPIGTKGFGVMGAGIQAAMMGALISRATLAAGMAAQQASMMGFGGMGAGMMGNQPGGGSVRLGNISGPGITTPIQQAMWDTIRTNVPHSVLVSATRTVQTEGHPDNHNMGKAIDLVSDSPGGMQSIARWIASNYPNSAELIHNPFGSNIKNGRNVGDGFGFYGAGTMAGHADHVHWAMNGMTPPAEGGGIPGMAAPDDIKKKFPQYSGWTTAGIQKYGQAMAARQMSKWGVAAGGAMYGSAMPMPFIAGNQQDYIKQIVGLAKSRGMGPKAAMIALMTAMQESNIRVLANPRVPASYNFPHDGVGSDHDSVGIFQQRPHWGPVGVLMNPAGSAGLFYNVLSRYNYNAMDPTVAAQTVQVSAYPEAYRKWQPQAAALVQQYYDEGGIANGKGLMMKNTLAPERVLSPRQTEAFEQLIPLLTGLADMGIVDYDESVYAVARDVHATARQIESAARNMKPDVIDGGTEINVTIRDATIVGVDELDRRLDEWGRQIVKKIEKDKVLKERRLGGR